VILAAGLGRRFGGSKQTSGVGPHGEWLLDYAIFDAHRAGFRDVVLIIRPGTASEFDAVRDRWQSRVSIGFAEQRQEDLPAGHAPGGRTKPWGTGQAVLSARRLVPGPFASINADDYYGRDAYTLAARAMPAAAAGEATIVGMRLQDTLSPHGAVTRGVIEAHGDRVTRITEMRGIVADDEKLRRVCFSGDPENIPDVISVSMNFWVFPRGVFDELAVAFERFLGDSQRAADAEFLLPDVVNDLVRRDRMTVRLVTAPGPWLGLTHAADRDQVTAGLRQMAADGMYPTPLWAD
jgi:NDP-sugar pyrophosphorylase family protein